MVSAQRTANIAGSRKSELPSKISLWMHSRDSSFGDYDGISVRTCPITIVKSSMTIRPQAVLKRVQSVPSKGPDNGPVCYLRHRQSERRITYSSLH